MQKSKGQWIDLFRQEAERTLPIAQKRLDKNKRSETVNKAIKQCLTVAIEQVKGEAKREKWTNEKLLNEILLATYASYIVMLEYRNKVWLYEYMAFARRIGELWEPFCKLSFEYPVKPLKIIEPQDFGKVQADIRKQAMDYISALDVSVQDCRLLKYYYGIPWSFVDSGGIKLGLDLHFEQNGIHYNCDFKSGFSSNEK